MSKHKSSLFYNIVRRTALLCLRQIPADFRHIVTYNVTFRL